MACRLLCQFLIHIIMLYNYRSFMIVLVPFRSRPLLRSARRSGWVSSPLNSCPVRRVDLIVEVAYSRKKSHGARIKFPIFFLSWMSLLRVRSLMWQRDKLDSAYLMERFLPEWFHQGNKFRAGRSYSLQLHLIRMNERTMDFILIDMMIMFNH